MVCTAPLPLDISLQQVTNVFQNLTALAKNKGGNHDRPHDDLSADLVKILDAFHTAQSDFINQLDEYMHKRKREEKEISAVKTIVAECPEFLTSKDDDGNLPIHYAVYDEKSRLLVPTLAKLDGKSKWGLFFVKNKNFDSPVETLVERGEMDILKTLSNIDPKLLDFKGLIANSDAIHQAVYSKQSEIMRWLVKLAPDGLYFEAYDGTFPIHWPKSLEAFKFLLQSAIKHRPHHNTVGGLFLKYKDGDSGIKRVIDYLKSKTAVFSCINQVLAQHQNTIPILHNAINLAPEYVNDIIQFCPSSCFIRDKETGRLPVHEALATGMKSSLGLVSIMNTNFQHLGDVDPVTEFCCGGLAAMEPSCDLDTIYHLFRSNPGQVEYMRRISKVRQLPSLASSADENLSNKRRKCN